MSSRKIVTLQQSSVHEETTNLRRSGRVRRRLVDTNASSEGESEEELPRKKAMGRFKKKTKCSAAKQEQHFTELPLVTAGHETPSKETADGVTVVEHHSSSEEEKPKCHEMPPGETRNGVPAVDLPYLPREEKPMDQEMVPEETRDGLPLVELPSSPEEEKPKRDLLFLLRPAMEPEDRQCLLDSAFVFKSNLVAHFKSSADNNLSTSDMKILASECYNVLEKLGDDYTSFHSEVRKLIAQHEKVESAAKDKEIWKEWEVEARYIDQVQSLYKVRDKMSIAEQNLSVAKTEVEFLLFKKKEMTEALRTLTEKLHEQEQRVKSLTQERDQFHKTHSDIKVGLVQLAEKKKGAEVAFEAYDAAIGEFERMSDHLLQSLKRN